MISEDAIKYLTEDCKEPSSLNFKGEEFLFAQGELVRSNSERAYQLNSLSGLVEFLTNNGLGRHYDAQNSTIIIRDIDNVKVVSDINAIGDRRTLIDCSPITRYDSDSYEDRFINSEDFMIWLYTNFEDTAKRKELLQYVSRVYDISESGLEDDGITQIAKLSKGTISKEEKAIENPIVLKPFVTFPEISQPEIPFLFRMNEGPRFMLKRIVNGNWRLKVIAEIAKLLESKLNTKKENNWRVIS